MTQYRWNDGTSAAALEAGNFRLVCIEAFNSCGAATDSIRVRFDECLDCVWVPNAFSPNGDGLNDLFGALIKCPIENYRLLIFNRWGQKVFESYKTSNTWDGSNQDTGTYFYSLSYRNKSNNQIMIKKGMLPCCDKYGYKKSFPFLNQILKRKNDHYPVDGSGRAKNKTNASYRPNRGVVFLKPGLWIVNHRSGSAAKEPGH